VGGTGARSTMGSTMQGRAAPRPGGWRRIGRAAQDWAALGPTGEGNDGSGQAQMWRG
jgi:hypothetical protein